MADPHSGDVYDAIDQAGLLEEEDEDAEEEEEEEEDETETEEEDEEEDVERGEIEFIPILDSPRVSQNGSPVVSAGERVELANRVAEGDGGKRRKLDGADACLAEGVESRECSQENEWNRSEIDGLFCPICMEAWTSDGDHHICSLPCGHIYGFSCIRRWLWQRRSSGKCPQCNRKCSIKDVRKLFASRIVAVDASSQKRIRALEAECAIHKKKGAEWEEREAEWKKREAELNKKVHKLAERTSYLEHLLGDGQRRAPGSVISSAGNQANFSSGQNLDSASWRLRSSCTFTLQKDLRVDGARVFDVDASNQIFLMARRLAGMGGTHVLTKISLVDPHETEDILLPSSVKTIKDLHISPSNSGLALFASLGKKLSVLSTQSNNLILTYDLPAAAWSCSWDLNCSYYAYAGLQNGLLLAFDMRQTSGPLESRMGPTCNSIHTLHSLMHNSITSSSRTLVSASSFGVCQWSFDGSEERPFLIPETENHGVCISLACSPSSDDIVASYRPRVEMSSEVAVSQSLMTPSLAIGQGVRGSHVHLKRVGSNSYQKLGISCANVHDIQLPKSAIIDIENQARLFASGDNVMSELLLQELPSFAVVQSFKLPKHPIRDMKYSCTLGKKLLCCLSEDALHLFTVPSSHE